MSQSACQWPALTTKRPSASSPRAPRAAASPSTKPRSSITARRPRRRAAGQAASMHTFADIFLFSLRLALLSSFAAFNIKKMLIFSCVHITFIFFLGLRINSRCIMPAVDTKRSHPYLLILCPTFLLKPRAWYANSSNGIIQWVWRQNPE